MADTEDFSTLKERAKKKLERDMGPLLLGALNDPRTVEIMLNAEHRAEGYGHAVGGHLSSTLVEWLREYAKDKASGSGIHQAAPLPDEVLLAMQTAWKAVTDPERHEYGEPPYTHGWVRQCGAFSLVCFGDACDLSIYPDETQHGVHESVQFGCHNLDSSEQQLTLVAGLAKLCELARVSS